MKTINELHKLSEQHPYYSSESNYYSNDSSYEYNSFNQFLEEMGEADLDMNLVFRWDLQVYEDCNPFLEIFIIQQRKGIYCYHMINNIIDEDVENIINYLNVRKEKLKQLWNI